VIELVVIELDLIELDVIEIGKPVKIELDQPY
jgi:hypothetical protein